MKRIGILALQGAFAEHKRTICELGAKVIEIRKKDDLTENKLDGIILPGGESTVIGKLLNELDIFNTLHQMIRDGLPVMGTCAGLILLAKNITNDEHRYLEAMDITVKRNAYGRQLGSFHIISKFKGIGDIPMTFIRAPYIECVSEMEGVEVLAKVNGNIVAAKQKNMLVTAFHPELTRDLRVHRYFLESCI
ncbi:MAG: pyridoxal 5'-phosphate synthase glutaminase subunit PdxT [Herbinix sp.]|nr:pyridoxal 5'-phosphate synthase glutaminase subunit PdxT [Herbinix sp.]